MEWQLLSDLPPEDVRELIAVARRRRFSKREVVFHRDDPGDSLHLVVKGRFAIRIMTPHGHTATIAVRGPGDSFGEMALVANNARRAATVTALEEAETFAIYKDDFSRLRRQHPGVTEVLVAFLAAEVVRQNQLLLEALYLPVEKRVIRRLVELAHAYAPKGEIPLTQEEIAEMAGTSRATVNAVVGEERERGSIELRRGRILVRDVDALTKRAR
jgi:CRP/FNR family cyclic AMP-dependent transcriptional regulator